jgi:hypothetical protein
MYMRSRYRQANDHVSGDELSSIIYQPVQVHSNINGGLGIFAGMNEVRYYLEIPR